MKLFWKLYSFLFFTLVLNSTLELLRPNSLLGIYYHTTIVFSAWHIIPYLLNILNALIACSVCLFIFGYSFDVPILSRAPVWLFYLRILSDCTGHSYEIKMIQSGFSQGKLIGFLGIATLIIPILPSYLVQWRMTFNEHFTAR